MNTSAAGWSGLGARPRPLQLREASEAAGARRREDALHHGGHGQPPPPHRGAHPRHRRHRAEEDHRAGLPHRPHQPHEEAEEAAESALGHPGPLLPAGGLRLQVQQRHGDCHQLLRHRPHL